MVDPLFKTGGSGTGHTLPGLGTRPSDRRQGRAEGQEARALLGGAVAATVAPQETAETEPMPDRLLIGALAALVSGLFAASLLTGPAGAGAWRVPGRLADRPGRSGRAGDAPRSACPPAILGLLIGATLGLWVAALQGDLRNPLAEPGLIGVSGAAALGAARAIHTELAAAVALALPLAAQAGTVVAVVLVLALASEQGGSITLILAGITVTSLASALMALARNLSPNPLAALEIVLWMHGSLADRSMTHMWLAAPFSLVGWAPRGGLGRGPDALSLGKDAAASFGIRLDRLRPAAVLGTASAVGAATAVAGAIGFVGLVAPQLLRPLVDNRPSRLLPASALGGAAVVLAAYVTVRLIASGRDLKLGVLAARVGAPFLLWLVWQTRRRLA